MSLVLFLIAFVSAAIGTLLADVITDKVSVDEFAGLTQFQVNSLIIALAWFLICLVVYFGVGQLENHDWFGLISPNFFLTWIFVEAGTILGLLLFILIDTGSLDVTFDQIKNTFFSNLPIALGPTASASIGLRSK